MLDENNIIMLRSKVTNIATRLFRRELTNSFMRSYCSKNSYSKNSDYSKNSNKDKKNIIFSNMIDYKNDIKDNLFKYDENFKFKINEIIFSKCEKMFLKKFVIGAIVTSILLGIFNIERGISLTKVLDSSVSDGIVGGILCALSPILVPVYGGIFLINIPIKVWYHIRNYKN